jgi:hypothetical protein
LAWIVASVAMPWSASEWESEEGTEVSERNGL